MCICVGGSGWWTIISIIIIMIISLITIDIMNIIVGIDTSISSSIAVVCNRCISNVFYVNIISIISIDIIISICVSICSSILIFIIIVIIIVVEK